MLSANTDFLPLALNEITADSVFEFDLHQEVYGSLRLFRHRSVAISQMDIDNLASFGHQTLYVPASQCGQLADFRIGRLPRMLKDDTVSTQAKLEALSVASEYTLEQLLGNPTAKENVKRAVDQSGNHATLALTGELTPQYFSDRLSSAPKPIRHAVDVCNLSLLLGIRCGFEDPGSLRELSAGAMLHEIGKRLIDRNYYLRSESNARTTNTRLRKYPIIGRDMLENSGQVPPGALSSVLEHQERLDGSGFPRRLKGAEISDPARIVAICDHYDEALHVPAGEIPPTPFMVLKRMREDRGKFDDRILVEFIRLLGTEIAAQAV